MSYGNLLIQIKRLSLAEQLALLEDLTHALRQELSTTLSARESAASYVASLSTEEKDWLRLQEHSLSDAWGDEDDGLFAEV